MLDDEFKILEDAIEEAYQIAHSEFSYGDESKERVDKERIVRLEALEKIRIKINK